MENSLTACHRSGVALEWKDTSDIFSAILVCRYMHSAKGTTTDFLFYDVLVNSMLGAPIVLTGHILGTSIECFLFFQVSEAIV